MNWREALISWHIVTSLWSVFVLYWFISGLRVKQTARTERSMSRIATVATLVAGERGQNRQQYAITPLGRRTLLERLRDFSQQDARSAEAFRARVGFFELLPPEDRERILGLREQVLRSRAAKLGNMRQAINLETYGNEVVDFMREQIAAELSWIRRLRRVRPPEERKEP